MAYRTPVGHLVSYLDATHGTSWAIWEFRAEGTGYPDDAVHNRILHFPFPDHHPPPFRLVPGILASMRNWLAGGELQGQRVTGVRNQNRDRNGVEDSEEPAVKGGEDLARKEGDGPRNGRVVVVHCKAGKGRSGTMTTAFLIAERNWAAVDALTRFTERRMRPGFGEGVSIPSQQRWISYVDRWARHGKRYVERRVQIMEVHAWGLRDGVRVEVEGFVDGGKKIKPFHRFTHDERTVVGGPAANVPGSGSGADSESEAVSASATESVSSGKSHLKRIKNAKQKLRSSILFSQAVGRITTQATNPGLQTPASSASSSCSQLGKDNEVVSPPEATTPSPGQAIILRPSADVILETNDVKISVQRRSKQRQFAPSIITTVAHVWFNAFFEGKGPELGAAEESGVFEVGWDEMDGLKGFMRVGTRAFERIAVVWRAVGDEEVIRQPGVEEDVGGVPAADWRGEGGIEGGVEAEAEREVEAEGDIDVGAAVEDGERAGLKMSGPEGEDIDGEGVSKGVCEKAGDASHPAADSSLNHAGRD